MTYELEGIPPTKSGWAAVSKCATGATCLLQNPEAQALRFCLVGGATVVLDYLVLYTLTTPCGISYLTSAAAAFIAGSLANYLLSIRFVFVAKRYSKGLEVSLFLATTLLGLGLNQLLMLALVEKAQINYLIAKTVSLVIVTGWNYISKKKVVFWD